MNIKNLQAKQPYHLFLLLSIVFFIVSWFFWRETTDIHLHDTYFVFPSSLLYWALTFIFLFVWLIYRLSSKVLLNRYLTWVHIVLTLLVLVLSMAISIFYAKQGLQGDGMSYRPAIGFYQPLILLYRTVTILFLAGLLVFMVNIIGGLIRWMLARG